MSNSAPKPVLLLLAVAGVLAVLVGLVRSAAREPSRSHASPPIAPWTPSEPVSLRAPLVPEAAPPASAPRSSSRPSASESSQRRELPRVSGRVLRPDGDPASEARVVLGRIEARCTPDGAFDLALTSDVGSADLVAFEAGYEPAVRNAFGASLAGGSVADVLLVLGPTTLGLTGTVTGLDGRPLEGWTVELDGPDPLTDSGLREPVLTDAAGHFLLTDVPAGIHVVRAFIHTRELAFRSPPTAAGETGLVIVADPSQ